MSKLFYLCQCGAKFPLGVSPPTVVNESPPPWPWRGFVTCLPFDSSPVGLSNQEDVLRPCLWIWLSSQLFDTRAPLSPWFCIQRCLKNTSQSFPVQKGKTFISEETTVWNPQCRHTLTQGDRLCFKRLQENSPFEIQKDVTRANILLRFFLRIFRTMFPGKSISKGRPKPVLKKNNYFHPG